MASNKDTSTVSKIAIVNPYLLRGLNESSEMEAIMRFIAAAKNLGIEAAVFKRSADVYDFNPDFVIPISQQEPKLTPYPTYGLFNNPIQWVTSSARFARNVFTYDGYFAVSPQAIQWLQQVCAAINKTLHVTQAAFTVPQTEFTPCDLSNASAAYLGVNWDGLRHFALFQYFQDGTFLKCYGPKESWMKYPAQLYGGMIPFDGVTALNVYRKHGIGLGINHPAMDNEGIPTCRTFEIPASGAVGIFSRNAYTEQKFGDSVFYVDHHAETHELAENIKEKINWIRSHNKEAQEMARSAHAIFNREMTLEHFIQNMVNMHQEVMAKNGFVKTATENKKSILSAFKATTAAPKITYLTYVEQVDAIKPLIKSIQEQTYGDIRLLLLFNKNKINESALQPYLSSAVSAMHYDGIECNKEIFNFLMDAKTEWFGILKRGDKLFANHCALLMNTYQKSAHDKSKENVAIVFGNSLDHAESGELRDKIQDHFMLYLTDQTRVGNITPCAEIPLCATLFKPTLPFLMGFQSSDFATNLRIDFALSAEPLDIVIHSNEISCSAAVCDYPAILVIQNVTSPLNFPSNLDQVTGSLLVDDRQRQKLALEQTQTNSAAAAPLPTAHTSSANSDYQSKLDRVLYQPSQPKASEKKYQNSVAIILRTKDRPICLPRAINSVLSQTYKEWQLIIVNDGGNVDVLEQTLRPFVPAFGNRVTVINHATSLGMSRGLNVAIDASNSEFIVVHDDDDSWHPEFLMQTVGFLRDPKNADCGGVVTHSVSVVEEIHNNQIVERGRHDFNSQFNVFSRISLYRMFMQNTFPPISFLFRRSVVDKIGYFNEDLPVLNDWDFNIRCLFHYEIGVIPLHLASYHHRANQQNSVYGNSIIATANLCLQYETTIRNQALRNTLNSDKHAPMLGLMMSLGGQELFNLNLPAKVDSLINLTQNLANWLQQNQQPANATNLAHLSKQIADLQANLDKVLQKQQATVGEPT